MVCIFLPKDDLSNPNKVLYTEYLFKIIVDTALIKNPDDDCIYLCGNSLGLQPKSARDYVNRQFEKWEKMFVNLLL